MSATQDAALLEAAVDRLRVDAPWKPEQAQAWATVLTLARDFQQGDSFPPLLPTTPTGDIGA